MRYWKRIDSGWNTTTVENYSHDLDILGAIEISKKEFDAFIASLPQPSPAPVRDLAKEFDDLTKQLKSKGIIS